MLKRAIAVLIVGLGLLSPALGHQGQPCSVDPMPNTWAAATDARCLNFLVAQIGVAPVESQSTIPDDSRTTTVNVQHNTIDLNPLIEALVPYVAGALGLIITALAGVVVAWLRKRGIDIDDSSRAAIETTAQNLAAGLIAKGAVTFGQYGHVVDLPNAVLAKAVQEGVDRAGGALKRFASTPQEARDIIEKRIVEKLPQVINTSPPAAPPA